VKDTSGDTTLAEESVRLNRDVNFKVFGGKDGLLYASLCVWTVGGFMPELSRAVFQKYIAGDAAGSLEARFKLRPVYLPICGWMFDNEKPCMVRYSQHS